jgi:hypothetical protein
VFEENGRELVFNLHDDEKKDNHLNHFKSFMDMAINI